jgi:hypothetical protein
MMRLFVAFTLVGLSVSCVDKSPFPIQTSTTSSSAFALQGFDTLFVRTVGAATGWQVLISDGNGVFVTLNSTVPSSSLVGGVYGITFQTSPFTVVEAIDTAAYPLAWVPCSEPTVPVLGCTLTEVAAPWLQFGTLSVNSSIFGVHFGKNTIFTGLRLISTGNSMVNLSASDASGMWRAVSSVAVTEGAFRVPSPVGVQSGDLLRITSSANNLLSMPGSVFVLPADERAFATGDSPLVGSVLSIPPCAGASSELALDVSFSSSLFAEPSAVAMATMEVYETAGEDAMGSFGGFLATSDRARVPVVGVTVKGLAVQDTGANPDSPLWASIRRATGATTLSLGRDRIVGKPGEYFFVTPNSTDGLQSMSVSTAPVTVGAPSNYQRSTVTFFRIGGDTMDLDAWRALIVRSAQGVRVGDLRFYATGLPFNRALAETGRSLVWCSAASAAWVLVVAVSYLRR